MVSVAGRQVLHKRTRRIIGIFGRRIAILQVQMERATPGQIFYTKSFLSKSFPSFSVRTFFCMSVMIRSLKTTFFSV
jgi:hypothetical protein